MLAIKPAARVEQAVINVTATVMFTRRSMPPAQQQEVRLTNSTGTPHPTAQVPRLGWLDKVDPLAQYVHKPPYEAASFSEKSVNSHLAAGVSNLLPTIGVGNHVLMAVEGTVYLLHFERPYHGPMQHYVGFTVDGLDKRLEAHREGRGGKTTRYAFELGIGFTLART